MIGLLEEKEIKGFEEQLNQKIMLELSALVDTNIEQHFKKKKKQG